MSIDLEAAVAADRSASDAVRRHAPDRGSRRGRKVIVTLLVLAGAAAVVAVLARRMGQVGASQAGPDTFGAAVRATDPAREPDGNSVTTC